MKRLSIGYRSKVIFIIIGSIIGLASLLYSNYLKDQLAAKERYEINLWSQAFYMKSNMDGRSEMESNIIFSIVNNITSIPAVITDDYLNVIDYQLMDQRIIKDPHKLRRKLEDMSTGEHQPIQIPGPRGTTYWVYYDDSLLLKSMVLFPFIQLSVIGIFIGFAFITFRSSKHNEQNKVWIGMAKETAHQLGTPTSSLLGWVEYLRTQPIDSFVPDEMSKDVSRLMKVADRFSKIGSTTQLVPRNIHEIVASTVSYFRSRIPKNVTLTFDQCSGEPLQAMVNDALFEWVVENLLKNALDALQGKGVLKVSISCKDKWIYIDVKDTGKGMSKANYKRIFRPGFTTKTRGWGLGLSLSKRIIEEYHHGRIFVKESEIDKGTTMRIMLKKL